MLAVICIEIRRFIFALNSYLFVLFNTFYVEECNVSYFFIVNIHRGGSVM